MLTLKEFIDKHGTLLGEKIEKELTPIYKKNDPTIESYSSKLQTLMRKPYPVQGEIIKGLSKAIYDCKRQKIFICGEMGTGKTMIALSVLHTSPKPLRTLVVCPGHLVNKWIREAEITIPDVKTVDLARKDAISILDQLRYEKKPQTPELWVISKERAKLSCSWQAVSAKRKLLYKTNDGIKKTITIPVCPDCGARAYDRDKPLSFVDLEKKKRKCNKCNSTFWQVSPQPRRWAPADYIKKYLKNKFDMVILDEVHDYKAGDTLQGYSMGSLIVSAKYFMGLTGTLNGGYADDLFYLLYRLEPANLTDFGYTGNELWLKKYGVIEEIRTFDDSDHSYSRKKKRNVIIKKRPGVSPEVIGKFFLDKTCFIRLTDVIDGLPPYDESVISIEMDAIQEASYVILEEKLKNAVTQYRTKATAAMLQSLLCYPDSCTTFPEIVEITHNDEGIKKVLSIITAPLLDIGLLPKEKELISLVKQELSEKRKVLVYLTFTGNRDIRKRIKSILENENIKVGILPETVEPKKREEWINKHSKDFDVLITNPELVKVGLDLVQFPTIVFFETGYNIFTLRQAARRSWRIGQKQPVKVFFLCYQSTMQETAISLIAKKLEISLLVEGDLPEGLAQYNTTGTSLLEEMIQSLVEGRKYSGAETAWANMRKKEIESSLDITKKETIFTEISTNKTAKTKPVTFTSVDNIVINITVIETKTKRRSTLSVMKEALDNIGEDKIIQFRMF